MIFEDSLNLFHIHPLYGVRLERQRKKTTHHHQMVVGGI